MSSKEIRPRWQNTNDFLLLCDLFWGLCQVHFCLVMRKLSHHVERKLNLGRAPHIQSHGLKCQECTWVSSSWWWSLKIEIHHKSFFLAEEGDKATFKRVFFFKYLIFIYNLYLWFAQALIVVAVLNSRGSGPLVLPGIRKKNVGSRTFQSDAYMEEQQVRVGKDHITVNQRLWPRLKT